MEIDVFVDWDVECLHGLVLLLVVGPTNEDIATHFIKFTEVVDLWNEVFKRDVFRGRSLWSLVLFRLFLLLFSCFLGYLGSL